MSLLALLAAGAGGHVIMRLAGVSVKIDFQFCLVCSWLAAGILFFFLLDSSLHCPLVEPKNTLFILFATNTGLH